MLVKQTESKTNISTYKLCVHCTLVCALRKAFRVCGPKWDGQLTVSLGSFVRSNFMAVCVDYYNCKAEREWLAC